MEKERIIEILGEWNPWNKDIASGVYRKKYVEQLEKFEKTGQIITITGVRRSGKSTLLKQYMKHLIQMGTPSKDLLYINFEEPRFAGELNLSFLQKIYDAYREIVKPGLKPRLFLDEVQNITGWERFARSLHEKNEAHLFASGSSAKLLSRELGTALTGRHLDLTVHPLDFQEFIAFNGLNLESRNDLLTNKTRIKQLLRDYLEYGGLPQVVLTREKQLLAQFFDDILLRDVAERHHIRKIDKLRALAQYYMTTTAGTSSFRSQSRFLELSLDSVERFATYLADAYLVFFVNIYSTSLKEQQANPKKIYSIDNGLRNVAGLKIGDDIGKLFENTVFLKLQQSGKEVYYYKGAKECDFIIREYDGPTDAIQVCYQLNEQNKKREFQGLLEAMEKLRLNHGTILTEDQESREEHADKTIQIRPLWKWLLQNDKKPPNNNTYSNVP